MEFLFWLYLTPSGHLAFVSFLAITVALVVADSRQRKRPRRPTFEDELAILRRDLRVVRDVRNN